ncbi:16S rRNA (guanine(966)-N(2))-methyltransferase RsmD [Arenimonas terrae]|jgi:16S rRNA (guanine966-N2)-methyltransferase|uniref:Ribosomal RNA small subunit methyltransferase D n=1 Tax=Arenimonas terrae TaxID=2546226 RepID=A0A5C4RRH2_9GAMM|nr:16S rRNA (guanine(966)-N(2))-methyltransferase RsmD [Arenimonas terrae]TNJ33564.1 16S rRNA (guanine(966)-N(2))-methyltransferase RsmD [Arenimonas terrae]
MNPRPPGQVRIIAGHLRGSKLPVPDRPGLRPSADRVRETLFNWLQPMLPGARVLDLFAGTGALGFEACSRGARATTLVERDPGLAEGLRDSARRLKVEGLRVVTADALSWLQQDPGERFDLVFLDPPFEAGLWEEAARRLGPWLASDAWIYVETPLKTALLLPSGWRLHREGQTREVRYALFRSGNGAAPETAATIASEPNPQVTPSA